MTHEFTRRLLGTRPARRWWALSAATATVATVGLIAGVIVAAPPDHPQTGPRSSVPTGVAPTVAHPQDIALASYSSCAGLLAGLRSHAAAVVGPDGLPGVSSDVIGTVSAATAPGPRVQGVASAADATQPAHSTTNDQESGADEPDLVKSDGARIVSVSGGVLRVIDTATRTITGTLDLSLYAGSDSSQLLVAGDRALVLMGDQATSTYLLIDLSGRPKVLSTFRPQGSYVDARLIAGRVRLVVRDSPAIRLPVAGSSASTNRKLVRRAPLSDWLPSYQVAVGGVQTTHDIPCTRVQHPRAFTAESMLTIYTIDPAAGFGDVQPVTLAADASAVYSTTSSLYVASQVHPFTRGTKTQVHRFDIRGAGRPVYLGSGTVPGSLLSSYSLSDYAGSLRVVTTNDDVRTPTTSVYVLDLDTLEQTGHVGGLGSGQRVYAVRFAGPLAYVVTFRSVDPLYVLDLQDPAHPRTAGELHITGYSSYLHPTSTGRLLGVGQDVRGNRVAGVQVSLFDVSAPAAPTRLDRVVLPHTASEDTLDPHAFLYWPSTGTVVVPIQTWEGSASGRVLVLHVTRTELRTVGTVANPDRDKATGIERSLVVGDQLWTMSPQGFAVRELTTLRRDAWISFS